MEGAPASGDRAKTRDPWLAETREAHKQALRSLRDWGFAAFLILLLWVMVTAFLNPIAPGNKYPLHSAALQNAHALGLALFCYANDNVGEYPDGASSTEVFQKLLDGGYVTDPGIFYVPMTGKERAARGQKLKPENVCFDVTGGVEAKDSGALPLVFFTGYRIAYVPGGAAAPVIKPFPPFLVGDSWFAYTSNPGLVAFYVDKHAVWLLPEGDSIPNIVPRDFDAHGKTYRQLTPDGVLR